MIQGQQAVAVQEREQEQIIGVLTGIVQKGPDKWQAVVVPDGSQYSKNLWTKDQALIQALSTLIGQRLAFLCNVSHWNMQDGTPVRSLWIEAAGTATSDSPALQGPQYVQQAQQAQQSTLLQPQVRAQVQQSYDDPKQDKIHRQTATKVAAILLSNLDKEQRNLSTLLSIAERLVAYYDNGLPRNLDEEIARATPQDMNEMLGQGPMVEYGGGDYDSDIPFMPTI